MGSMFLKLMKPVTKETGTDKILEEKNLMKDLFFFKFKNKLWRNSL
jgi:hypothetical protein